MSDTPRPPQPISAPVEVALAVPVREGKILVARRRAGTHLPGTWEFPGGKIAPDEEPCVTARRELQEETGLLADRLEPLLVFVHEYPEHPVRLHVFLAQEPGGEVAVDGGREWAWRVPAELGELEMPSANTAIVRALRWRLQ